MSRIPNIDTLQPTTEIVACDDGQRRVRRQASSRAAMDNAAGEVCVSVVTPCFNPLAEGRADQLRRCMDSVQSQQDISLEHIIIDGGSTDGTQQWLQAYKAEHHTVRLLSQKDSGLYEAMNRGIALARGRCVIFLGSDDFFHRTGGMATAYAKLQETGCDFTFAPVRFLPAHVSHHPQLAPQKRLHRFLISWPFSHQSMLTERQLLLRLDGFDTTYRSAADYDLLLRLIEHGARGCFVPLDFATFSLGGFSAQHKKIATDECINSLQGFFRRFYSTAMTHDEVAHIVRHRVFPHRYLSLYKQTQQLVGQRFTGLPSGPLARARRLFNYIKYYIKCLTTNI